MPRFGTRTLLVVFALVAVWFATFGASSSSAASVMAAQDLRRSMLLLVLVAAIGLAITRRGRTRAFWAAFSIVMVLCGGINLQRPLHRYVPDFAWQQVVGVNVPTLYSSPVPPAVNSTVTSSGGRQVVYSYTAPFSSGYFPGTPNVAFSTGWSAVSETAAAAWTFALAALGGFVAAFIYSRSRATTTLAGASSAAREIVEQELHRM
jgi:hypothetical protein